MFETEGSTVDGQDREKDEMREMPRTSGTLETAEPLVTPESLVAPVTPATSKTLETPEKPATVGFTAGVFDLFHVGHLNLLERARQRCGFLRVGVISDEICAVLKRKTPVVPLEERMRIVAALRCVDDVVAITDEMFLSKVEAFYEWPFDVAFSGSDHESDPYWQREAETLAKLGARIEYLPYTESTSSTLLRRAIGAGAPDSSDSPRNEAVVR